MSSLFSHIFNLYVFSFTYFFSLTMFIYFYSQIISQNIFWTLGLYTSIIILGQKHWIYIRQNPWIFIAEYFVSQGNITVNILSLHFFETTFLRISCLNNFSSFDIFSAYNFFFWQHLCKLNLLGHLCWLNLLKTLIDFIILYNSKKNYIFLFFDISFLSFHVHVYNYPLAISLTVSILKEQHLFLFVFFSENFLSFFLQTKNFAFCISFFKQLVLLLLLWQHHAAYIPILLNVFR